MADGSVTIGVVLDTAAFAASIAAMQGQLSAMALSAASMFVNSGWAEAGQLAASAMAGGITAGGGMVAAAVQSVSQAALAAFDSGGWSSVGANIMSGIASGIYAAGAEVIAAINTVSRNTEEAVKEYYAIRSPSALMRDEVGVMISRGIAEGILSGAGFVSGAMESVGRGADRVRLTEGASGGGRSVTQNIYLRDSDASPYRTARRIRRESEAIFRN